MMRLPRNIIPWKKNRVFRGLHSAQFFGVFFIVMSAIGAGFIFCCPIQRVRFQAPRFFVRIAARQKQIAQFQAPLVFLCFKCLCCSPEHRLSAANQGCHFSSMFSGRKGMQVCGVPVKPSQIGRIYRPHRPFHAAVKFSQIGKPGILFGQTDFCRQLFLALSFMPSSVFVRI